MHLASIAPAPIAAVPRGAALSVPAMVVAIVSALMGPAGPVPPAGVRSVASRVARVRGAALMRVAATVAGPSAPVLRRVDPRSAPVVPRGVPSSERVLARPAVALTAMAPVRSTVMAHVPSTAMPVPVAPAWIPVRRSPLRCRLVRLSAFRLPPPRI